jgi:hypothetical protein
MRTNTTEGWKLVRQRKDGTLGPLFINRPLIYKIGVWFQAEDHPTKGFARRPGFHACSIRSAPHLEMRLSNGEQRVWCKVLLKDFEEYERPASQGNTWILSNHICFVEALC